MAASVLSTLRPVLPALSALVLVTGAAYAQALETLSIATQGGQRQSFRVEVARNDADRAQGLMFRRSMPADQGMLFDFGRVEPVSMWMQNTYLSLDMLFIRADGTIARIAANTEPLSTRTIPSGEPVLAVLELNAGTAAKLGIKAGDRVEHPIFKR
ncbi:DUF192 domain-containing protein [Microvirga arsenatis]|uniref:DUF192 domain-containing protein n=1 Tax=Microvirga arsenatis TaxID=2692265 RepID=A0ABW9Z1X8_9HYPH|nr:DUF192 domain-containing protein [Microvirga arsenatis]NBJ12048.1 DUF192 domain-containing protein [Microvirga arsenatis]NBJ25961.1 DUF192 domain-containing protein [Microvirga arsenatis]